MGEPLPWNEPVPQAVAGLREILERARRGEVAALPELREALRSGPDLVEYCGDLAAIAERAWVALVAGQDLVLGESVKLRPAGLKASLAGLDPTPLERLAIERVSITWLQCGFTEAAAAGPGDVAPRVAEFAIERQDRAQKRHLAALASLAMIRKLAAELGGCPGWRASSARQPGRPPLGDDRPGTVADRCGDAPAVDRLDRRPGSDRAGLMISMGVLPRLEPGRLGPGSRTARSLEGRRARPGERGRRPPPRSAGGIDPGPSDDGPGSTAEDRE
jgi:hypothetical protein